LIIKAIACAVPSTTEGLDEWGKEFGEDYVRRVTETTGITHVRKSVGVRTSDLCVAAALEIIDKLDISKEIFDALIFVSQTPNDFLPATACQIQNELGLKSSLFAIDVNLGCSGYPYALSIANSLLSSGMASNVLVLAGDVLTPFVDPKAPSTRMVFGDAGSATWAAQSEQVNLTVFGTDGEGAPHLFRRLKSSAPESNYVEMDGMEVLRFALKTVPALVRDLSERSSIEFKRTLDQVFLHQANRLIVRKLEKACDLPSTPEFPLAVEGFGNTGPASIPLAICEWSKTNKLGLSALVGFGVGWSWSGIVTDLSTASILPVIEI
jgi:3-oxoacyl-[acyl-carrier-protein] synthase-3